MLTWIGVLLLVFAWSAVRGGDVGRNAAGVIRAFFSPRIFAMFALVIGWQLVIVFLAERIGFWDSTLTKDTLVIVAFGGFVVGFKALALMDEKGTWRGEVRSLLGLVVIIQWVSNLQTFPYLIELGLVLMLVSLLINAFARFMVGRVLRVGEGAE